MRDIEGVHSPPADRSSRLTPPQRARMLGQPMSWLLTQPHVEQHVGVDAPFQSTRPEGCRIQHTAPVTLEESVTEVLDNHLQGRRCQRA